MLAQLLLLLHLLSQLVLVLDVVAVQDCQERAQHFRGELLLLDYVAAIVLLRQLVPLKIQVTRMPSLRRIDEAGFMTWRPMWPYRRLRQRFAIVGPGRCHLILFLHLIKTRHERMAKNIGHVGHQLFVWGRNRIGHDVVAVLRLRCLPLHGVLQDLLLHIYHGINAIRAEN